MRESVIEKYLHKQVVAAGGWTDKFVSPGRPNVPDRIVTWPGEMVAFPRSKKSYRLSAKIDFVECKAPGEKARPAQVRDHDRRRCMGATVLVLDTKELVDLYVEHNREA